MADRWDFSAEGRARVGLITILGTLGSMAIALLAVSYTTQFMTPVPRLLSWIAAIAIPLVMSAPIFWLFCSKLRDLAITHRQLALLASQDSLTGCLNRGAYITLVDAYLTQVNMPSGVHEGALLVIDADHFKDINDRFGHASGDTALRLLVSAIRECLRSTDLLGRVGGEEFSVFLPRSVPLVAALVADRIRSNISSIDFSPNGVLERLSVSVGGATYRGRISFNDLFNLADARLYEAKARGRNRVEWSMLSADSPALRA